MKLIQRSQKIVCLMMAVTLLLAVLFGCAEPVLRDNAENTKQPTDGAAADAVTQEGEPAVVLDTEGIDPTDFYVNQRAFAATLLKEMYQMYQQEAEDKGILLSPLSAMLALTLAATGAQGDTRTQMEAVLGTADADALMAELAAYISRLPSDEYARVLLADSVWIRERDALTVNEDFLKRAKELYGAEIYAEPFDGATAQKINAWAAEQTDGMIDRVIEKIESTTVMYLINALLFDAQWAAVNLREEYKQKFFSAADGTVQNAYITDFRSRTYFSDGYAVGTRLSYANGYSMIAMLPNEDVSMEDYIASLSGERLSAMLRDGEEAIVSATVPHFSFECEYELREPLIALGMEDAFVDGLADFSSMVISDGESDCVYINNVIQKTAVELNEVGTRAAAVTVVIMETESASAEQPFKEYERYTIIYDRPFVFMIVDSHDVPLFFGVVNTLK
ncbi:MAG: serpin family protein [Clostridia bacterium]|nr:serpin family protein [Clostridia bacterium]